MQGDIQETAIIWCRDDKVVKVSSSDKTFQTAMKNKGWEGVKCDGGGGYVNYVLPMGAFTIRKKGAIKKKRNVSEEERQRRRDRMLKYHESLRR